MKKTFCTVSVVLIILFSLSVVSFARDVSYENLLAQELKELGLFKGVSETDFDLDREPSRVEAIVMLIRILGVEKDVIGDTWRHPFSDVPSWADKYVGYAYSRGLTNGQSATEFGNGNASAAMYVTFVLRALGYSDANGEDFTWNNPFELAKNIGIVTEKVNLENFLRSDVVLVSHSALSARLNVANKTLSQKLMDAGVFSASNYKSVYGRANSGLGTGEVNGSEQKNETPKTPSFSDVPRKQNPEEAFMALVYYLKEASNNYLDNGLPCYYKKLGQERDSSEFCAYYDKTTDLVTLKMVFHDVEHSFEYLVGIGNLSEKYCYSTISVYNYSGFWFDKIATGSVSFLKEKFGLNFNSNSYKIDFDEKLDKKIKDDCKDYIATGHATILENVNEMLEEYAKTKDGKEVYSVYDFGYINYK